MPREIAKKRHASGFVLDYDQYGYAMEERYSAYDRFSSAMRSLIIVALAMVPLFELSKSVFLHLRTLLQSLIP